MFLYSNTQGVGIFQGHQRHPQGTCNPTTISHGEGDTGSNGVAVSSQALHPKQEHKVGRWQACS